MAVRAHAIQRIPPVAPAAFANDRAENFIFSPSLYFQHTAFMR